jgi:hypothetical protein
MSPPLLRITNLLLHRDGGTANGRRAAGRRPAGENIMQNVADDLLDGRAEWSCTTSLSWHTSINE